MRNKSSLSSKNLKNLVISDDKINEPKVKSGLFGYDSKIEMHSPLLNEPLFPLSDPKPVVKKNNPANRVFSDMTNIVSDQSLNDICANMNKKLVHLNSSKANIDAHNGGQDESHSNTSAVLAKTLYKKKKKQRLDPATEK